MTTGRSLHDVLSFLERMRSEKKMPSLQVSRFKTALTKISADEHAAVFTNVSTLDMKALFARFRARNTDYTGSTLQAYENTFARAITEFGRYMESPNEYTFQSRTRSKKNAVKQPKNKRATTNAQHSTTEKTPSVLSSNQSVMEKVTFPIPLRPDVVVMLQNIPFDLTTKESDRICQVIKALAR